MLNICVEIHVPRDFRTNKIFTLHCSHYLSMQEHNRTNVRHKLGDIVDKFAVLGNWLPVIQYSIASEKMCL